MARNPAAPTVRPGAQAPSAKGLNDKSPPRPRAERSAEVSFHWLRPAHASHSLDRGAPIHLASRAGESHPHALPEPYVTLSRHTAPDVRPFPCGMENGFALATELLPLPVGSGSRRNTAAPLVQFHYRTFLPPTSCSAPVPRIGTLILAV